MLARDSDQILKTDYEQLLHGSPLPAQQPPVLPPLLYEASSSVPSLPPQAMPSQSAMAAFQCSPLSTRQSPLAAPQPSPFAACQTPQPALQLRSSEAFQPPPPTTFQTPLSMAHQSLHANITEFPQSNAPWAEFYRSGPQAFGMLEHDDRHSPSSTMPDSQFDFELDTADPFPEEEEDAAAEGSDARIVCTDDLLMLPSISVLDKYMGDADDMCRQQDLSDNCTCEPSAASTWSCQLAPVQPQWSQHTVQDIRHIAQVNPSTRPSALHLYLVAACDRLSTLRLNSHTRAAWCCALQSCKPCLQFKSQLMKCGSWHKEVQAQSCCLCQSGRC